MLCENCRIMFAFYLKYCRQCGRKLSERDRVSAGLTVELGSVTRAGCELEPASSYATAPITMSIGAPGVTIAEAVRQVLESFPSIQTTRLSDLSIGGAQPMREFSMDEFRRAEHTTKLSIEKSYSPWPDFSSNSEETTPAAETVPLSPYKEGATFEVSSQIYNRDYDRRQPLRQTRARLHLRPTETEDSFEEPSGSGGVRFSSLLLGAAKRVSGFVSGLLR
jgi:hypothetical protein